MSAALATGLLAAAGIYLLLQRGLVRIVVGFLLLQHAVNLVLVTARTPQRSHPPILPFEGPPQDPLGQVFVLTAIVIGLASTIFLLTVALRHTQLGTSSADDDVEEPDRQGSS